jgi:hypothetical protein
VLQPTCVASRQELVSKNLHAPQVLECKGCYDQLVLSLYSETINGIIEVQESSEDDTTDAIVKIQISNFK